MGVDHFLTIISMLVTIFFALIAGVVAILNRINKIDKDKVDHDTCRRRRKECVNKIVAAVICLALLIIMTGCVNRAVVDSYKSYLNTAGKEHQEFVEAGKYPDGSEMSEGDKTARRLNYESSKKVVEKAEESSNTWNWLNWGEE